MANILIIDDDDLMCQTLSHVARRRGHEAELRPYHRRGAGEGQPRRCSTWCFSMCGCLTAMAWTFCPRSGIRLPHRKSSS